MKTIKTLLCALAFFVGASCSNSNSTDLKPKQESKVNHSPALIGEWVLISREYPDKKVKKFSESPADFIVEFEKNGYFEIYDKIKQKKSTDDKPFINRRRLGQWTIKDSTLTFIYEEKDSTIMQQMTIVNASDKKLTIKQMKNNVLVFDSFIRK